MKNKETKDGESSTIFQTHYRFLRSTNIETDWHDPLALEGYTFTPHAALCLSRLAMGLKKGSTLRSWRITGDYGTGKSSFALLLANILAKRVKAIPSGLRSEIKERVPDLLKPTQPVLVPIIITGSRQSLGKSILIALLNVHKENGSHGNFYGKLEKYLTETSDIGDDVVIEWVKKSQSYFIKQNQADGLILLIDEAGKFFEGAALHPEKKDIFLLQSLAEIGSRSGGHPIFVVTILHQGIAAYGSSLSKAHQKEWEKIAGRFEEISWHYPVEQSVMLAAKALNVDASRLNRPTQTLVKKSMQDCLKIGWFGTSVDKSQLVSIAQNLYPVHPTVFPVLVKIFSSLGQNERTLYSFLLGAEPFGLQDFFLRTSGAQLYQLFNLYDYTKATFGSKLSTFSYHWKAIDALVNSYSGDDAQIGSILKTIGILNLVNANELVASLEVLEIVFGSSVSKLLSKLAKSHLIHYRGVSGGYCVWPNTSVNLEDSHRLAKTSLGELKNIKSLIRQRVESRPIVARRHYIEKGTLRFFEIRYVDVFELGQPIDMNFTGDGLILIPLCESLSEITTAISFAQHEMVRHLNNVIIVIPGPLAELTSLLEELRTWEWIERSIGELRHDRFAREEVARRINVLNLSLQQALQRVIGLNQSYIDSSVQWYHKGEKVEDLSGQGIMRFLAGVCDECYKLAPRIDNELINRRQLSPAGASARLRLCENLLECSNQAYLGMDPQKRPPEMSMYLSVLQETGLHTYDADNKCWRVSLPEEEQDSKRGNVLPVMIRIHDVLSSNQDKKVEVLELFKELKAQPYGVREGLIPLLLAVFSVIHEQEIAFYEDGSFIPRITGSSFLRLIKAPETFRIQYYPITGVRTSLFQRLFSELELAPKKSDRIEILDVIRPLFGFVSGLPEYVLKTTSISETSQAVRHLLLTSTDPVKLIFTDLPAVFGIKPIGGTEKIDSGDTILYIQGLKNAIDELRACYPNLLRHLESVVQAEFNVTGNLDSLRKQLYGRAEPILGFITEINLKSFSLRLADSNLSDEHWIEALAGMICAFPPKKWRDREVQKFEQDTHNLVRQFMRVESILFENKKLKNIEKSVRVAVTRANGEERGQVIHLTIEEMNKLTKLENEIDSILQNHGQVGIAAATEVLWRMMNVEEALY